MILPRKLGKKGGISVSAQSTRTFVVKDAPVKISANKRKGSLADIDGDIGILSKKDRIDPFVHQSEMIEVEAPKVSVIAKYDGKTTSSQRFIAKHDGVTTSSQSYACLGMSCMSIFSTWIKARNHMRRCPGMDGWRKEVSDKIKMKESKKKADLFSCKNVVISLYYCIFYYSTKDIEGRERTLDLSQLSKGDKFWKAEVI